MSSLTLPIVEGQAVQPQPQSTGGMASPAAFSQTGTALEQGGAQIEATADKFADQYAQAKRYALANSLQAQNIAKISDAEFRWSKVPDRDAAMQGFNDEVAGIRKSTVDGIDDPMVSAIVGGHFDQFAASAAVSTGNQAFAHESSAYAGDLDTSLNTLAGTAATASSDLQRQQVVQTAHDSIAGAVNGGWITHEDGARRILTFNSGVAEVAAKNDILANPEAASAKLSSPAAAQANYPGLLPEVADNLAMRADNRAFRIQERQLAMQAHSDATAERNLRTLQSTNEAKLLGGVYQGNPPSAGTLADLAASQQISPGGMETIHGAIVRGSEGYDNTPAVVDLYAKLGNGQLNADDIHNAISTGNIKGTTALELMRGLNEKDKQGDDAIERGAWGQLKTALSGGAVEQGLFSNQDKAPQVALYARAQGEWTDRVMVQHQDPQAVLSDMLPRYTDAASSKTPIGLPNPRMGAIANYQDMQNVAAKTGQALQSGQIDRPTYDSQVQLLNQYKSFYDQQQKASTVTAPKPPSNRPAEGG